MVIRREIAEKHPWTVLNLLKAYDQANAIADRQRIAHVEYHVAAGADFGGGRQGAARAGDPARHQGQPQDARDRRASIRTSRA